MPRLFDPFSLRGVTLRNRIGVSPMCQYTAEDGFLTDWHLVHLGARAIGGAGLIITEATAVEPRGRISPGCPGLWDDAHIEAHARITAFEKQHGAVPGIQIAHAGRKASSARPWDGGGHLADDAGGWPVIGPSAVAFGGSLTKVPAAMTPEDIRTVQAAFVSGARRALAAGYEWLELHGAHGYLMHSFLSPLSNHRTDTYGGSFENRTRFVVETARAVRAVWPEHLPLTIRLSTTDWVAGGWTLDESVELARLLKAEGVDLVDCSSGGNTTGLSRDVLRPGYQVPFAERIRREAGIATAAVGLITEPAHADAIVAEGRADLVYLAREFLRDPQWPRRAAAALGVEVKVLPRQYARA
ncbi:MAG: NADH:flavin oxidoreductase/NADH oxidase [Opitutaceae bacterium]|nr:NADH:flavin oxidoreductase/NADH oxidase [Opitutaceae bacterium]